MKKIITLFLFTIAVFHLHAKTDSSKCNWKANIASFDVYNNCDSHKNTVNLVAKVKLNQIYNCKKAVSKVWEVNKSIVGYGESLYHQVTKNGTYTVCLYLYDSCNRCDTVICESTTVKCFGTSCNWKSKVNDFFVKSNCDSSLQSVYLMGSFILNKNYACTKGKIRKWSINKDVVSTSEKLYYNIKQNGTYTVCLSLYDSCNNCDTSFCSTITVNCIKDCNWSGRISNYTSWYTCDTLKNRVDLMGKLVLSKNQPCSKVYRQWTVNNTIVGTTENMYYPVYNNGSYKICVLLYDSCSRCDTTICETVHVTCFSSCNWKSKINDFFVKSNCDSAPNHAYLMGSFNFNKNYTCQKGKYWKWKINNDVVGTGEKFYFNVKQNGSYTVCLSVYDSCNKCDTSFCSTVVVNCASTCQWKSRFDDFKVYSNCDSQLNHIDLVGRIHLTKNQSCNKVYRRWSVDNKIVSYSENFYYPIHKNGSYKVCVLLYDSCSRCDTSICETVTVNCFPSCNWKSKVNDFFVKTNCDSAPQKAYLMGSFILNKNYTCSKGKVRHWTVNNDVVSHSEKLYFNVKKNGTYTVCLSLYDSCNNCDTVFCKTLTVNCLPACDWSQVFSKFNVEVNCDSTRKDVFMVGKYTVNPNYKCSSKVSIKWIVNKVTAGYGPSLNYRISQNGMYNVCVVLYDSCNKCDTLYCRIVPVNCRTLGLVNEQMGGNWSLFPNPANTTFELRSDGRLDLDLRLEITDISGKVIQAAVFDDLISTNILCNIADLPKGMYFVRIIQGTQTQVIKLFVE